MNKKLTSIFVMIMLLLTSSIMVVESISIEEKMKTRHDIETFDNGVVTWHLFQSGDTRHVMEENDGYVLVGNKWMNKDNNWRDSFIIKLNKQGEEQWRTTFDYDYSESLYWVDKDIDGGYISTGYIYDKVTKDYDLYVAKFDSTGEFMWAESFDKANEDYGFGVYTDQSGYIVFGNAKTSDKVEQVWIFKISRKGSIIWEKLTNVDHNIHGREVRKANDGEYILTGTRNSRPWLAKIKPNGDTSWEKIYNDIDGGGVSVIQTSNGGYAIGGRILLEEDPYEIPVLIITDSNGNLRSTTQFEEKLNGVRLYGGGVACIDETSDGGLIIFTQGESGQVTALDWVLIKTDPEGNELWRRAFEGQINLSCSNDYSFYCETTNDGGIIMIGKTEGHMWVVKTDSTGHLSQAPITPTINGPSEGYIDEEYTFTFDAVDPDGDQLYYRVHFGLSDYGNDEWVGPFTSGEEITISYDWALKGNYTIKLTLYDQTLEYSETATKEITINQGKSKNILFESLLERFLSNFPILNNLLN